MSLPLKESAQHIITTKVTLVQKTVVRKAPECNDVHIYIYIKGVMIRVFVLNRSAYRLSVRYALQTERFRLILEKIKENKVCKL